MPTNGNTVITILMLGGSRRVSLAEQFKRSAQQIGCEVRFFAYELDTHAISSRIMPSGIR